jgi:hypothetical protein
VSTKLEISNDLALPLDFVTQTQAILAKRGVGRTYTASVQAEEMLKCRQQVVIIDPTGAWWGLRSSADGKRAGFPIPILGGEHGNVPLEERAGEVIAAAIVERRFSAVIDLSLFRKGQIQRFMAPFLETLYRLNREAMHLFVDEADSIAPQKPFGEEARALGAMEDVVRRGRRRGIGCTLISQRPAVLNKNVLTQCEILCALRLVHPRDIDAIEEWVNVHADPVQAKEMIESLPSLPIGTAWFWSPGWGDIFQRVHIRKRETFDSSATPKVGEKARQPIVLAPVEIEQLGTEIAAAVQRAKENDPKRLESELMRLRDDLAKARAHEASTARKLDIKEIPALKDAQIARLEKLTQRMATTAESIVNAGSLLGQKANEIRDALHTALPRTSLAVPRPAPQTPSTPPRPPRQGLRPASDQNGERLPEGERVILTAVAQYRQGATRDQLTVLSGYKRSTRNTYVHRLSQRGYVDVDGDRLAVTGAGLSALGKDFAPLPTGDELRRHWLDRLPIGERNLLEVLVARYPKPVPRDDLDALTGYTKSSRNTYLHRLNARRLIRIIGGGQVSASDELFDALVGQAVGG